MNDELIQASWFDCDGYPVLKSAFNFLGVAIIRTDGENTTFEPTLLRELPEIV